MPDRRDALIDFVSFAFGKFEETEYDVVESIESLVSEWRLEYERRRTRESMDTPIEKMLTAEEFEARMIREMPGLGPTIEEFRARREATTGEEAA